MERLDFLEKLLGKDLARDTMNKQAKDLLLRMYAGFRNDPKKQSKAKKIEGFLLDKITVKKVDGWMNKSFCSEIGNSNAIDPRMIVFCCPVSKNCPFRALALKKLGIKPKYYPEIKKKMAAIKITSNFLSNQFKYIMWKEKSSGSKRI